MHLNMSYEQSILHDDTRQDYIAYITKKTIALVQPRPGSQDI